MDNTVCPGSSDPFYILTYYIKWATTSWIHSMYFQFEIEVFSSHENPLF